MKIIYKISIPFFVTFFFLNNKPLNVIAPVYEQEVRVKNPKFLFDDIKLMERLEELSSDKYEGRLVGSRGSKKARNFIINEFKELQVSPLFSSYEQPFTCVVRNKNQKAANVLGEIKGTAIPEKYIIISAHYDHLGIKEGKIYNGSDDNASGVCALFAFAEYFKKKPPLHTVILAAFDAEEIGLKGADYFVKNSKIDRKKIALNINMDMIGRSIKNEIYVVGARYNKVLKRVIKNFNNPTPIQLLQGHDGTDKKEDWTFASDHAAFHKKKIPFLYFGEEDHPDYHKDTDEFHNINPVFYKNSVALILSVFSDIDNSL